MTTETLTEEQQRAAQLEAAAAATAFTSTQKLTATIKTSALKEAVGRVGGSISTKASIPSLTMLYFYINQDRLELRGSNGSITTQTFLPLEKGVAALEGEAGGMLFPGKKFMDLLAKLTGVNTVLTFDGLGVKIKSKGAEVNMTGLHLDLYPQLHPVRGTRSFEIPTDVLLMMYKRTDYAVSKKETDKVLTSVMHELKGKSFRTVACDRHRLAAQHYDLDVAAEDARLAVPAETVSEVKKSLKGNPTTLIEFNDSSIMYTLGNTKIYSSVYAEVYPQVDSLIPPTTQINMTIGSKELKEIFDRCSLFQDEQGCLAHMIINPVQRRMRVLTATTAEGNQLKEDVQLTRGEGDDLVLSCNVKYFTDMLAHAGDVELSLGLNAADAPMILRTYNGRQENVDLVLPIRVAGAPTTPAIENFNPIETEGDAFAAMVASYGEQA
ncbi:DNA polymerase III subunit beta (plasmid) [Paenibacillus rhizovicinus]|uniref:Beta sliding clamp n=1 Tax=Paenibacillus rhizovicinus TaxID=2704463 RepID=A0A6C0PB28_9BACL|nr:DNA polymerase III subunit beta [Paenibacillus rhizovicinus]QHW35784.1 DNA polymerase III subunit beta [Paenibacillus rhizovicinus]